MARNAQRGAYYKGRTKKWLAARGWQVADMEVVRWIYQPGRQPMPVKRDQFASDLLAMNASRIVFVQCKGGEAARGGTFPAARRAFEAFVWPVFVERWIIAWAPRSREPRIINARTGFTAKESTDGETEESGRGPTREAFTVGPIIEGEGARREGHSAIRVRKGQTLSEAIEESQHRAREVSRSARSDVARTRGGTPRQAR